MSKPETRGRDTIDPTAPTERVTIRIPKPIMERLRKLGRRKGRGVSDVIRAAIVLALGAD